MFGARTQIADVPLEQANNTGLADSHPAAERHPHTGVLTGIHQRGRRIHRDGLAAARELDRAALAVRRRLRHLSLIHI